MKKIMKRYRVFFIVLVAMLFLTIFNQQLGIKALRITGNPGNRNALVIPPIFILLGLLDVWVPRETMIKYMVKAQE